MFSEQRRPLFDPPRALGELIRIAGKIMAAKPRMLHCGHKVSMLRLFVVEKGARRVDRRGGQTERLELVEKLLGFVIERPRLHQPVDGLA